MGQGMLLSLLHGLRGTHGSGDPGQCPCLGLGGPAQVGGSGVGVGVGVGLCGGSQALPPSVPCLRLPLGLRDLAKPLDFLPGLGRVFHQEPCQQPRDVRAPCSPWPQATSCLLLLGAPWLPWGPPSRKHGALPQAGGGGLISPAGLLRHTARNGDCPGHSLWTGQHPACFRPRGTLPGDPGWPAGDQVHGALGGAPCCPRALISPTPDTQRARPRGPATRPQPIPPHPRGSGRQPRPHAPAARPHAGLARSLQWAEHDRGLGRQSSCGSPSL